MTQLLTHAPFIRRLVLIGAYVEGTWLCIVRVDTELVAISVLRIYPDEHNLRIQGTNYGIDGRVRYSFSSRSGMLQIDWPSINFAYFIDSHASGIPDTEGVSTLMFARRGLKPPVSFVGSFTRPDTDKTYSVQANLIRDKETLLAVEDPAGIGKLICERVRVLKNEPSSAGAIALIAKAIHRASRSLAGLRRWRARPTHFPRA